MKLYVIVIFAVFSVGLSRAEIRLPPYTPYPKPSEMEEMSIRTIIERLGLAYESYEVITEDGYILNLNRMVNPNLADVTDKGVPVLFVNGMQMYSETWFLQSKPEINPPVAYLLRGYDVWLGDQRGAIRSRRHVNMTDDMYDFWDFSFHETGVFDLPAFVDFIIGKTKHEKVVFSGLSLSGAFYYVMCAERPEYQDKLYGAVLFQPSGGAPKFSEMSLPTRTMINYVELHMHLSKALAVGASLPKIRYFKVLVYYFCNAAPFALLSSVLRIVSGGGCEFDQKVFCSQLATAFGGSSVRTVIHSFQIFRNGGKLTKYDWGPEVNRKMYGTETAPEYDVSKVRVFTAVYVSDTDVYTPTRTVVPFLKKLSGPSYVCRYPKTCHMFTEYDQRMETYVQDSADVLDSMTGRTNSDKTLSQECKIDSSNFTVNAGRNGDSSMKILVERLLPQYLPNFIATNLL